MCKSSGQLLRSLAKEMRRNPTDAERRMWECLRGRRCLGLKFRRQVPISGFLVDFYCARPRIVIEVDGAVHLAREAQLSDMERDRYLKSLGINVLRFSNDIVLSQHIEQTLRTRLDHSPSPHGGEGVRG